MPLTIVEIVVGAGEEANAESVVTVRYAGTRLDTSVIPGATVTVGVEIPLIEKSVIEGFRQGVVGMKVGGKRRLTITPDLAYGATGIPPVIAPNTTLVFEVELLFVNDVDVSEIPI